MPRQKKTARPVNKRAPAAAADGTNPPIANDEKLNINFFFNNIIYQLLIKKNIQSGIIYY